MAKGPSPAGITWEVADMGYLGEALPLTIQVTQGFRAWRQFCTTSELHPAFFDIISVEPQQRRRTILEW